MFPCSLPHCFEDCAALVRAIPCKERRQFLWAKPLRTAALCLSQLIFGSFCLRETSRTLVPQRETLALEVRKYVYLDSSRCLYVVFFTWRLKKKKEKESWHLNANKCIRLSSFYKFLIQLQISVHITYKYVLNIYFSRQWCKIMIVSKSIKWSFWFFSY